MRAALEQLEFWNPSPTSGLAPPSGTSPNPGGFPFRGKRDCGKLGRDVKTAPKQPGGRIPTSENAFSLFLLDFPSSVLLHLTWASVCETGSFSALPVPRKPVPAKTIPSNIPCPPTFKFLPLHFGNSHKTPLFTRAPRLRVPHFPDPAPDPGDVVTIPISWKISL